MTLTFTAETHQYAWDGVPVAGVTELLDDVLGKPFYPGTEAERKANLVRGRHGHEAIQFDDEGTLDEAKLDPALQPYLQGWRWFRDIAGWKSEAQEIQVYSPTLRVAGRIDKIGTSTIRELRGGRQVICDVKTGTTPPRVRWQLALYALIYAESQRMRPEKLGRMAVTLPGNGTAKLDIFSDREDLDEARALVTTYHVRRKLR